MFGQPRCLQEWMGPSQSPDRLCMSQDTVGTSQCRPRPFRRPLWKLAVPVVRRQGIGWSKCRSDLVDAQRIYRRRRSPARRSSKERLWGGSSRPTSNDQLSPQTSYLVGLVLSSAVILPIPLRPAITGDLCLAHNLSQGVTCDDKRAPHPHGR